MATGTLLTPGLAAAPVANQPGTEPLLNGEMSSTKSFRWRCSS